jgi:hypothetical protein
MIVGKKVQLYDKEQLPFDSTAIRFGDSVPQDIGPGKARRRSAHLLARFCSERRAWLIRSAGLISAMQAVLLWDRCVRSRE